MALSDQQQKHLDSPDVSATEQAKKDRTEAVTADKDAHSGETTEGMDIHEPHRLCRYFLMRCSKESDIEDARTTNTWPTNPIYDSVLRQAYSPSVSIYFIFTVRLAREFYGIARMASEIRWLTEKTIFDRSKYRQKMQLQWISRSISTNEASPAHLDATDARTPDEVSMETEPQQPEESREKALEQVENETREQDKEELLDKAQEQARERAPDESSDMEIDMPLDMDHERAQGRRDSESSLMDLDSDTETPATIELGGLALDAAAVREAPSDQSIAETQELVEKDIQKVKQEEPSKPSDGVSLKTSNKELTRGRTLLRFPLPHKPVSRTVSSIPSPILPPPLAVSAHVHPLPPPPSPVAARSKDELLPAIVRQPDKPARVTQKKSSSGARYHSPPPPVSKPRYHSPPPRRNRSPPPPRSRNRSPPPPRNRSFNGRLPPQPSYGSSRHHSPPSYYSPRHYSPPRWREPIRAPADPRLARAQSVLGNPGADSTSGLPLDEVVSIIPQKRPLVPHAQQPAPGQDPYASATHDPDSDGDVCSPPHQPDEPADAGEGEGSGSATPASAPVPIRLVPTGLSKTQRKKQRKLALQQPIKLADPTQPPSN
ncbi:hypothetical protein BGX28_005691 [Mortierella sp. GBA30]|nr:hypothetical protein BGX28_005691 [Mortierella sp. GBA30]